MAGQDLFDQSGPGARHAEDENRRRCVEPTAGKGLDSFGGELLDQPIDQFFLEPQVEGQGLPLRPVGRRHVAEGAAEIAEIVMGLGQAEIQVHRRLPVEAGVGAEAPHGGEVRVVVREFLDLRQIVMGFGLVRRQVEKAAVQRRRPPAIAQLLGEHGEIAEHRNRAGIQGEGGLVGRRSFAGPSQLLTNRAQIGPGGEGFRGLGDDFAIGRGGGLEPAFEPLAVGRRKPLGNACVFRGNATVLLFRREPSLSAVHPRFPSPPHGTPHIKENRGSFEPRFNLAEEGDAWATPTSRRMASLEVELRLEVHDVDVVVVVRRIIGEPGAMVRQAHLGAD